MGIIKKMSYKKIEFLVKKFNVKNNDTILIRSEDFDSSRDIPFLEKIRDLYKKQNKEITIINIPMSMNIEKLSEKHMNSLGWYRNEGDDFSE